MANSFADSDALKSKLCYRIFASIDVAGSTAFKQSRRYEWVKIFEQFFEDFPVRVREAWEKLPNALRGKPAAPMRVWKYVGDEILFVAELSRHEEVLSHIHTIMAALDQYSLELKKHRPLGLKAAFWTAGFPVGNAEVQLKQGDGLGFVPDFLGPDVDLGFRLASFADGRRIPLNVQLVWLLIRAISLVNKSDFHPTIYYSNSQALKGVLSNRPYPIFWIDRRRGAVTAEDALLSRTRVSDSKHISSFIHEFVDECGGDVEYPFIVGDPDDDIGRVPEHILRRLREQLSGDPDYLYRQAVEGEAADAEALQGRSDMPEIQIPRLKRGKAKGRKSTM